MIAFPRPIPVVQLLKKKLVYGKALKAYDTRMAAVAIPDTVASFNGAVQGEHLYLTEELAGEKQLAQAACLILLDEVLINAEEVASGIAPSLKESSSYLLLPRAAHSTNWDVFGFKFTDGVLEVSFEWDYFMIGQPERSSHKLFDLTEKKVIRFSVNGKVDSTLTVGTRRYYQEMEYVFHYLGVYPGYQHQAGIRQKSLDAVADKTVSLMKTLY